MDSFGRTETKPREASARRARGTLVRATLAVLVGGTFALGALVLVLASGGGRPRRGPNDYALTLVPPTPAAPGSRARGHGGESGRTEVTEGPAGEAKRPDRPRDDHSPAAR